MKSYHTLSIISQLLAVPKYVQIIIMDLQSIRKIYKFSDFVFGICESKQISLHCDWFSSSISSKSIVPQYARAVVYKSYSNQPQTYWGNYVSVLCFTSLYTVSSLSFRHYVMKNGTIITVKNIHQFGERVGKSLGCLTKLQVIDWLLELICPRIFFPQMWWQFLRMILYLF